jgi:hypothetical protein
MKHLHNHRNSFMFSRKKVGLVEERKKNSEAGVRVLSNFRNPQLYTQIWNMNIAAKWSSRNVILNNPWQHHFFFFAGGGSAVPEGFDILPQGGRTSDFLQFYTVFCFTYFRLISRRKKRFLIKDPAGIPGKEARKKSKKNDSKKSVSYELEHSPF